MNSLGLRLEKSLVYIIAGITLHPTGVWIDERTGDFCDERGMKVYDSRHKFTGCEESLRRIKNLRRKTERNTNSHISTACVHQSQHFLTFSCCCCSCRGNIVHWPTSRRQHGWGEEETEEPGGRRSPFFRWRRGVPHYFTNIDAKRRLTDLSAFYLLEHVLYLSLQLCVILFFAVVSVAEKL